MSMKHPEVGALLAYVDGEHDEATAASLRGHLDACTACSAQIEELRSAADLFSSTLPLLDGEESGVARALAAVRARRAGGAPGGNAPSTPANGIGAVWSKPLAKAAVLVLAFGGLASGLPGSPVRAWLVDLTRDGAEVPVEAPAPAETAVPDPGVRIEARGGRAYVNVEGLSEGGHVLVRLVEGTSVGVFADPGASFTADGVEVTVAQAGDEVVVEFPASLREGAVRVDGSTVYLKDGDRVESDGVRVEESTEVRISR